ncbi:MAG: carbohydrate kinase family protein [Frankia sp.]
MTDASPSYVVFGHLIIDDLQFPDGSHADARLGGAGTYAALGAALVSGERVGLVSGVGRDVSASHLTWLASWGIDTSALIERGRQTPRSRIAYRRDGSRSETPLLGDEHFTSMDPTVGDLPTAWAEPRGVYFFADHDAWQWPALLEWARCRGAQVMWEISATSCNPAAFTEMTERLRSVDILSINLSEAQALTGLQDPIECADRLRQAGVCLVTLRMGAEGALVADRNEIVAGDAAVWEPVIDPTGAGNCHSGAFLAAWCQTGNLRRTAALASAAAAMVLGHHGVPPPRSPSSQPSITRRAARVGTRVIRPRANFPSR